MEDKSLGIFLMTIFGILGIAILVLAWLWPLTAPERIMTAFIGLTGLFMALTRIPLLRSKAGAGDERVAVAVEVSDKL